MKFLKELKKIKEEMSKAAYSSSGIKKAVLLVQLTTVIRGIVATKYVSDDNKKKIKVFC